MICPHCHKPKPEYFVTCGNSYCQEAEYFLLRYKNSKAPRVKAESWKLYEHWHKVAQQYV